MRISTEHTDTIVIEEGGYLEAVAVFDIEGEEYPAEPFSWGGSRGTETEVTAELISARIGNLSLSRAQVSDMIGEDVLQRQENHVAGDWIETRKQEYAA